MKKDKIARNRKAERISKNYSWNRKAERVSKNYSWNNFLSSTLLLCLFYTPLFFFSTDIHIKEGHSFMEKTNMHHTHHLLIDQGSLSKI